MYTVARIVRAVGTIDGLCSLGHEELNSWLLNHNTITDKTILNLRLIEKYHVWNK